MRPEGGKEKEMLITGYLLNLGLAIAG